MQDIRKLIETEFITWLESKPSDELVGSPNDPRSCLLTKFLNEKEIYPVEIWFNKIEFGESSVEIPSNIANFIERLSDVYNEDLDKRTQVITAEQALNVWYNN
jgi:hypothetical protein